MGSSVHLVTDTLLSDHLAEFGVAIILIGHVLDEVGQFVTGIYALEVLGIVNVIAGVHQPVSIEDDDGIHAESAAPSGYFVVTINGGLSTSLVRSV